MQVLHILTAAGTTKNLCAVLNCESNITKYNTTKTAHFKSHVRPISIKLSTSYLCSSELTGLQQCAVKLLIPPVINNHMGSNQMTPSSCCIPRGLNLRQQVLFHHGSTFCLDLLPNTDQIKFFVTVLSLFFFDCNYLL